MKYTYGVSTVGGVLDLCLVKFQLLLMDDGLDFCMFCAYYVKEIFGEDLGPLHLPFVRPTAGYKSAHTRRYTGRD